MLLQNATAVIYDITSHSWAAASIIVKYYLLVSAVRLYTEAEFTIYGFRDRLLQESRLVIPVIVLVGIAFYLTGLKPVPVLRLVSEVIALAYLGLLFWEY